MDGSTAAQAATRLTGQPAGSARPVGGSLFLIELADGREVVVKEGAGENASEAEAASLMWLADSGTVRVPEVYGHDERWLVMEPVPGGSPSQQAAEQLGRDLAAMHDAGAPAFGAPPPGGPVDAWIGLTSMINETGEDWPDWYASKRIEPYLRKAADSGAMDPAGVAAVAEVCERVGELAGPPEPPSRLHGDLWSGNVMWTSEGAVLIDPAAHGGHRETDLAMLALFGCPYLDEVISGYQARRRLRDGWRNRVGLHQLYPLLAHVVLFGVGYQRQTLAAAATAL
jgi:fructosamine-3-kinase